MRPLTFRGQSNRRQRKIDRMGGLRPTGRRLSNLDELVIAMRRFARRRIIQFSIAEEVL